MLTILLERCSIDDDSDSFLLRGGGEEIDAFVGGFIVPLQRRN
jgi:hypothetical protein